MIGANYRKFVENVAGRTIKITGICGEYVSVVVVDVNDRPQKCIVNMTRLGWTLWSWYEDTIFNRHFDECYNDLTKADGLFKKYIT